MEELGYFDIYDQYKSLCDNGVWKDEFQKVNRLNWCNSKTFFIFEEPEWVKIVLKKIHGHFYWLRDKPIKIKKKIIHEVAGFSDISEQLALKSTKKSIVEELTKSKWDKREMIVNDIIQLDVKFSSMILG